MLAKHVMRNGIDLKNRIWEQLSEYKEWLEISEEIDDREVNEIVEEVRTELIGMLRIRRSLEKIIMQKGNDAQRVILRLRYFENAAWDFIADEMGMPLAWVREQHHEALKKINCEEFSCAEKNENPV